MPEPGRDLTAALFGGGGGTSVETWRQTLRLDDLERQYQLPSGLMTSVLRQESGGDPRVRSSAGAQGLFQFMPATAAQYKIDPFDPQQAAPAAAKELSSLYKKYHGDVDRTLAAWNWGQGNVDRKGMANMPTETRGFLTNVKRFLSPGVAEAATTPRGRDLSLELFGTPATSPAGRDLSQEILPPAAATQPPSTPQATPQPAPAAQAAPAASQTPAPAPQAAPARPGLVPDYGALLAGGQDHWEAPRPVTDPAARLAVGGATAPAITSPAPSGAPADLDTALERELSGTPGLLSVLTNQAGVQTGVTTGRNLGRAFGPRGEAIGGILGGILGGIGSNIVNRETGMTPPSQPLTEVKGVPIYTEDVLATVLPPAGAAVSATIPRLPGSARVLHERGAQLLDNLGLRLRPPVAAETLFQQAGATGGTVPTANLWRASGDVLRAERALQPAFQNTEAMRRARGLLALMRQRGGNVSITELDEYRRRLGQLIGTTTDQAELGRLRQLYAALHSDLEAAASRGGTGAAQLREAIQTGRREHAMETLTDLWSPGKGIQMDQGDIVHVYGKRIQTQFQKRLHDDALFRGSWTPDELRDIQETLRVVGRTTARAPTAGAFTTALKRGVATAGGIMTGAQSDPMTGMMTYAALETVPVLMAAAMRSTAGRAAIRAALEQGNGQLSSSGIAMITQAVRDATDRPPQ